MAGKSDDFDKVLKFTLCCIGKGDFTLKAEQLDAIKYIYVKMYFCGNPRDFIIPSATGLYTVFFFQLQAQ